MAEVGGRGGWRKRFGSSPLHVNGTHVEREKEAEVRGGGGWRRRWVAEVGGGGGGRQRKRVAEEVSGGGGG